MSCYIFNSVQKVKIQQWNAVLHMWKMPGVTQQIQETQKYSS